MTQIKLRRDTSANFASVNPVLGIGEPAYETDTKKLKIGDGATAYTQLEYFSAGGGGSSDITATLPLKIVDGVISLEVDGQTIQVVDGKLHANLDELGNEVNSLSGEVTDLSGRVTAAEANLDKKENKITTTGALSLQEKIISNLTNMTETETQITPNINQYFTVDPNEFYFSDTRYNSPQCYIAIPYQFGQWLKIPGGHNTQPSVFFGHFLEDGDFLITAVFRGDCYETSHPIYGGIVTGTAPVSFSTYSGSFYLNAYGTVSEKAMNSNIIFTETDPCAYLQLIDNTSSGNIICGSYNYGYGPNGSGIKGYAETHVVYNRDLTNYTVQDFVRDTTTALIMSPSTSYPILKSAVGLYAATSRLGWNQDGYNQLKANLGENLFDLTKSQVNNYLELNLGDGLSVVDGKLTASSTAPSNMVTTDTNQTITGTKTFGNGKLILEGWIKSPQNNTVLSGGTAGLNEVYLGDRNGSTSIQGDITLWPTQQVKYKNTGDVFLHTANLGSYVDGTTITYTNNKLTATGGGSSEPPANMVTTDTAQTIRGHKTFSGQLTVDKIDGNYGLYISTHPLKGAIRFGNTGRDVIIAGKGITTEAGDKFLTSGDKETIMGYMMPDYSTRTEVPWNTDNTAPTDGYVEVFGEGDGSTSAFVLKYTINGVETAVSSCYATTRNTNFRLPVICPKGTVYKAIGGAMGHDLHFISMKGAV